jgi:hypothetical protein
MSAQEPGMPKIIFFTFCSKHKDDSLKGTGRQVTPNRLYLGKNRIEPFMSKCMTQKVEWAIFSDKYGLWYSGEMHAWYEKPPYEVSEREQAALFHSTLERLRGRSYDRVYFYAAKNFFRVHRLYRELF